MQYKFEARYRGVPREAAPVVRQFLRDYMTFETGGESYPSDVLRVTRVGQSGLGFIVSFVLDGKSAHMTTVLARGMSLAGMALKHALRAGVLKADPNLLPCCYVRAEAVS